MRLIPSDPDIQTIVGRLRDGSLDLQPDFQRGSVWSQVKQRLLIDSILRNWYVPPLHVVRTPLESQEVLDGQQRLRAILDFVNGELAVFGAAEPFSEEIANLDGLRYQSLPDQTRRRFDRFTLRVFELIDYEPEEPYELFFRLNQPTALTAAEMRNAFFGKPREQVRDLARHAEAVGMTSARVGFSNARLSHEDAIARFVWTLERGSLGEKLSASRITNRYRDGRPFADEVLAVAAQSLEALFGLPSLDDQDVRFNKATTHSWLCFIARSIYIGQTLNGLDSFVRGVETQRLRAKRRSSEEALDSPIDSSRETLYLILSDRATSRVNDVASVILRDVVLWALFTYQEPPVGITTVGEFMHVIESARPQELEEALLQTASVVAWERLR